MKKKSIIAILVMLTMCFSLSACGGSSMTKEEMLGAAEKCSATDIQNESVENIVSAKEKFCNKTLLLSGTVRNIMEDHIELSAVYSANYVVDVYLPTEEIKLLKSGQYIEIVGTTTDKIVEDSVNVDGFTFEYSHYQMPSAYLVKDVIEVTGILKGVNYSYNPAYNIQVGNSNVYNLIYFEDGVDTGSFKFNQKIKFEAKAVYENSSFTYYDAKIIK